MTKKYKRVLLKVSGEALMGNQEFGHDKETLVRISKDIKAVIDQGIQVAIVVGGGNIYRGGTAAEQGMGRASADYIGMLATVMNALTLQNELEGIGVETRVQSAIPMMTVCESYIRRRALRHLQKKRVVIFAGGTGNPFFTTDTAAALRAVEVGCDLLLKGTQVDGVYSADPKKDKDAIRYDKLTFKEVLNNDLGVMDSTAVALARENKLPIAVFSIQEPDMFAKVLNGTGKYTLITE